MLPLSLVWFFFLGGMGFILPFFTLYLKDVAGLSGTQVGAVVATMPAIGLLVQGLWGQLSDRSGARRQILALLALGAALGQVGLLVQRGFVGLLLTTAAMACFSTAVVPLAMASSLAVLAGRGHAALGRVRIWGTLGFAVSVLGFPFALARLDGRLPPGALATLDGGLPPGALAPLGVGGEPGLAWIFVGAALCMATASLAAWCVPDTRALRVRAERGDWRELLTIPDYRRALAFQFVCFLALQGPMQLFPLLVKSRGGGVAAISEMWAFMLALEVPLVLAFGWSVSRLGIRGVILIGMAAASLRWIVSGWVDDLQIVTLVQLCHGITVWGVMLGFPVYVDAIVPERLRSTAQGLSAVVGLSLASIVSNFASGWLVDLAGATAPARVGGVLAALAVLLMAIALPEPRARLAETQPETGAGGAPPR